MMLIDGIGGDAEDPVEEPVHGGGPESLGERRRSGDVHEQEETILGTGAVVAAEHDVAERAPADDAADLQHEEHGEGEPEGKREGERRQRVFQHGARRPSPSTRTPSSPPTTTTMKPP